MYKLPFLFVFFIVFSTIFSENKFSVEVVPTISDQSFDMWHKGHSQLPIVKDVVAEQVFYICLFFDNYGIKDGESSVKYWVKRTDPDGSVGYTKNKVIGINLKNSDGTKQLTKTVLRLSFKKDDAIGMYKFDILSLDYMKKKKIKRNFKLELKTWEEGNFPKNQAEYLTWIKQYYTNPNPNAAIHAYMKYFQPVANKNIQIHFLHFYAVIFKKNPHLIPSLLQNFKKYSMAEKVKISMLMNYIDQENRIAPLFEENEKQIINKTKIVKVDIFAEMSNQRQINMLWIEFYATGQIAPLEKIIDTFKYYMFTGSAKKYKSNPKQHQKEIMNEFFFKLAIITFKQHYQTYPLIKKYSSYILKENTNPKDATIILLKKLIER